MMCGQWERVRKTAAAGNEGLRGREFWRPPVGAGCFGETTRQREPLRLLGTSIWHCEHRSEGEHICFYLKQSWPDTAGSWSLLLKAFWGLQRDSLDRVIYPLFAAWIGGWLSVMYMDVEFQSVILNRDTEINPDSFLQPAETALPLKVFTSLQAKLKISILKKSGEWMKVSTNDGKTNVIFPAEVKQSERKWELQPWSLCTHLPQFGHIKMWRKIFLRHYKDFEQSP